MCWNDLRSAVLVMVRVTQGSVRPWRTPPWAWLGPPRLGLSRSICTRVAASTSTHIRSRLRCLIMAAQSCARSASATRLVQMSLTASPEERLEKVGVYTGHRVSGQYACTANCRCSELFQDAPAGCALAGRRMHASSPLANGTRSDCDAWKLTRRGARAWRRIRMLPRHADVQRAPRRRLRGYCTTGKVV